MEEEEEKKKKKNLVFLIQGRQTEPGLKVGFMKQIKPKAKQTKLSRQRGLSVTQLD